MSDSFADLWNSSAPAKPSAPKLGQSTPIGSPALGGSSPSLSNGRVPQRDIFAVLSTPSISPSPGPSRTITPAGGAGIARSSSAQARGGNPLSGLANGTKMSSTAGHDAFSGLGLGGSSTDTANMTIAQRAAREAEERQARAQAQQEAKKKQESAWAGLDALGGGRPFGTPAAGSKPTALTKDEDWAFDFSEPVSTTAPSKIAEPRARKNEDDWGLSKTLLNSQPISKSKLPPSTSTKSSAPTIWDFDTLSSPLIENDVSKRQESPPLTSSTDDFNFGNREDRYNEDSAEEDLLGSGDKSVRPKHVAPRPKPSAPHKTSSHRNTAPSALRGSSPPPHIVGQIVEMGFTPQQARVALAATDSGIDVQAALDNLLSNGAAGPEPSAPSRQRYDDDDEGPVIPLRRRPPPGSRRTSGRDEPPPGSQTPNLQEQADRILASATEIGAGLFSKANAFWAQGKERVQRAYEERAAVTPDLGEKPGGQRREAPVRDGRPRWMQEAVEREDGDWGVDTEQSSTRRKQQGQQARPTVRSEPSRQAELPQAMHPEVKTGDLFSDEAAAAYVSPFRRRPAADSATTSRAPVAAASSSAPRVSRVPSPPRLMERHVILASASAIAASVQHKAAGTEKFKLGQFADAETLYTNALAALPDGHLLRVPLLTNRALARIRTGQHAGAVEDCTTALSLLGPSFHPAKEKKVEDPSAGAGVDLADCAIKARRRRAEAAEGREKWADAKADWEVLAGTDWVPARVRSDAVAGAGRCRKMEITDSNARATSSSRPGAIIEGSSDSPRIKSRPKTSSSARAKATVQSSGEALARVQAANRAAEAEDDQKHALKDAVDAHLLAWRGGKETNLRALLASLDTVLWPELGMPKVGMHELVTPSQVKVKYTRAIARLHPDKLNVGNTTLEQRMIANGVFGALNEAWLAFKQ